MTLAAFYTAVKEPCETDPPCLGCRVEAAVIAALSGHVPTVEAFTAAMQEDGREDDVSPEAERLAEIYQRMQTVTLRVALLMAFMSTGILDDQGRIANTDRDLAIDSFQISLRRMLTMSGYTALVGRVAHAGEEPRAPRRFKATAPTSGN